jgi:hypothetical protein
MKRVALAIMRIQPLHKGHTRIINKMNEDYETVLLGIGSTQKSRELWDPWTFEERKTMIRNVYGDRVKIVQLQDLGTTDGSNDWVDYVLGKIKKLGMPEPTDYFTGSLADARWYTGRFVLNDVSKVEDHTDFVVNGVERKLHIIERSRSPYPPATDLRTFMSLRDDSWKQWIPAVNWDLVESTYPEGFRIKC